MSKSIIYKATNVKTNKSYIGKTVKSLKIRINQHKNLSINGSQTYFHRAIRKYDFVNFEWSILFKGECSDNKLNDIEIFYIGYYDTFNGVGYNMTIGGDGASSGQNHVYSKANTTKEFRKEMGKRISNALKNRTIEKKIEHDKRISDSWNTKSLDEKSIISGKQWETKYKNKEKLEESNRKISKANSGKNSSSAKKWLIISPEGKEYQCYGNLNNQCKKLNISHDMIRFWVDKGPIKTKKKGFHTEKSLRTQNWECKRVNT